MKKVFLFALTVLFLFSSFTSAFAAFSDIPTNKWGWALEDISKMSESKIISGYPDNTFKPEKGVTKLESLLLISRIIGVNLELNKEVASFSQSKFDAELKAFNIDFKKEISYLLYKNILSTSELATYISPDNKNAVLKRYEAAILITKMLGEENLVKDKVLTVLNFNDTDKIPSNAKPYVSFVTEQGIMKGVSAVSFSPLTEVNRAQMAVMLSKAIEKLKYSVIKGFVSSVDTDLNTISIIDKNEELTKYNLSSSTLIKYDGIPAILSKLNVASEVILSFSGDKVLSIDGLVPNINESVFGIIKTIEILDNKTIYLYKSEADIAKAKPYILDKSCTFTKNGSNIIFETLKTADYIKADIKNGKVVSIEVLEKANKYVGIVEDIVLEGDVSINLKTENNMLLKLLVSGSVLVYKNGSKAELRDVYAGDKVTLSTEYGIVKKIEFTTKSTSDEGIIDEIVISKNPSIKVKKDDKITTYFFSRDVEIKLDEKAASIYDLRLGFSIKLSSQNNTITKIETKSISKLIQLTGTVEIVNASYGFMSVVSSDDINNSKPVQVFVKKGSKIINSKDNSTKELKDIKKGDIVSCIGNMNNDIFEATTVIQIIQ